MKVLHVLNELMASGAEVMMHCATPYWRAAGIEAEVLSTGDEIGPYAEVLQTDGYPLHHIPFKKTPFFFFSFFKLIRAGQYAIVHIHCERAAFYYGFAAYLAGAGIVRTIHSHFPFEGFLAIKRSIQRRLFNWLGGIQISISPSVKINELDRFGNQTKLIENWFDVNRFKYPSEEERRSARAYYNIQENDKVVVSVGNCEPIKNHPELLKALAILKNEMEVKYIHVGREERGNPERILTEELGLSDSALFLGYTPNILPALHSADIYVMPSIREGFGIAAIEALGAGLPAVLSDVIGLRALKEIPGTFFTAPHARQIAMCIKQLMTMDKTERKALGRNASNEVRQTYGTEKGVCSYVEVYSDLFTKSSLHKRI